jgi:hypothetical protein
VEESVTGLAGRVHVAVRLTRGSSGTVLRASSVATTNASGARLQITARGGTQPETASAGGSIHDSRCTLTAHGKLARTTRLWLQLPRMRP